MYAGRGGMCKRKKYTVLNITKPLLNLSLSLRYCGTGVCRPRCMVGWSGYLTWGLHLK